MRNKVIAAMLLSSLLLFIGPAAAGAMDGCMQWRHPFGDYCDGMGGEWYGALKPVKSAAEARRVLERFYINEAVIIGPIKERQLFYEADIKNTKGGVIDRVIVDKRSGRIRSID